MENGKHNISRSNRYWVGLWFDLVIEQIIMKLIKSRSELTTDKGMTEIVRHLWVHTNHACTAFHHGITNIINLSLLSSEQHAEMGKTRKEGNYKDLLILYDQLSTHSPFNAVGDRLRSIRSRIKVPNNIGLINCDNMEQIEEAIKMDRIFLHAAKIKAHQEGFRWNLSTCSKN